MESNSDLNLRKCLVWETEKPPFWSFPYCCESSLFSSQGRNCYLKLTINKNIPNLYSLVIISNDIHYCSQLHEIAVYLKQRTGDIVLTEHRELPTLKISPYFVIWRSNEFFNLDDGLIKFIVFFGGCAIEDTLGVVSEKDKPAEENTVQIPLFTNFHPCLKSLLEDLHKLLDEGPQKDVELKCRGHTVSAHKNVLSIRSEVFNKMLQSGMQEGRTGVVEIQDMDYNVLVDFLRYLYTGTLPELTTDTAICLYKAGDKYAVEALMTRCSDFLKENMTSENACELLSLADAHSDSAFKEDVTVYVLEKKIPLLDHRWQDFCRSHSLLATGAKSLL